LAVETYESIIDYILHKFGEAAVKKFVAAIDERMLLISSRPKMFRPTSRRKHTYIVAINRRLTLTYRYQSGKKEIELGVFWALQGPKRKPH
jgi:plasmid stabilization system protein ParE